MDTTYAQADTSAVEDTLRTRFIPGMGSITEGVDSAGMFHRSQLIWADAKYFGDLTWRIPGFFLTDLGEVGKPNFLSASGVGGTGVSILLDGRPLNDPITGLFNLYDIPMEFIEQVEVSQGSPGFLFGHGGTSATLNFVTRHFNSLRPITKIRYVQSQSETILTDVLFTQNVARSFNLMIAFQRHVSDGRYTNSVLDAWNLRTRLRYNVSDRLNISLTDFYTKTFNGLNGGVNLVTTSTIFDNVAASVNYEEASERIARRDVTLSVIGKPFEDSSSVSQLSLYYSQLDREYRDQAVTYTDFQNASFVGARLTQRFVAGVGDALAGFDYQQQKAESITLGNRTTSLTAFFGKLAINLGDVLTPSFFARYEVTRSQPSLGFGSDVTLTLSQGLQAFAGFNQFVSFPTLAETHSSDTSIIRGSSVNNRRQRLVEAGLRLMPDSSVAISITGFRRSIQDAFGFLSSPAIAPLYPKVEVIGPFDAQIQGITGSIRLRFWKMEGYGTLTFTDYRQADTAKTLVPKFVLAGELSYRDRFFEDALDARFGLRSRFVSGHRGFQFIPHLHLFAENRGPQPGQFSTVDVFAILRIGDAYISLAWENLLNTNYFISPVSPLPGRNFRFGVDWVFID